MSWKNVRKRLRSFRLRMSVFHALAILGTAALVGGLMYYRLHHSLLKQCRGFLEQEVEQVRAYAGRMEGPCDFGRLLGAFRPDIEGDEGEVRIRILDRARRPVASDEDFPIDEPPPDRAWDEFRQDGEAFVVQEGARGRRDYLVLLAWLEAPGREPHALQLTHELRGIGKLMRVERENLAALGLPLVLFCVVLGWVLARRGLRPVREVTRAARRITATNLGERLPSPKSGDEMDVLIHTFNDMIARLDASVERIARFTADASHELRTPLTAIQGEVDVALRRERTPAEYRETLDGVSQECRRMRRMVESLLALSRADAAAAGIEKAPVALDDLLAEVTETFRVAAEARKIDVRLEGESPLVVAGDALKLTELFSNLLDNAVKYSDDGGTVRVETRTEPPNAVVTVRDTGVGIAPEDLARVFERFYRTDSSRSRDSGGVGLGLSLCQWIAEAHGGRIEVASTPGKGTTFTVLLPLPVEEEPPAAEPEGPGA
jgi:heavy metal sensor kinase